MLPPVHPVHYFCSYSRSVGHVGSEPTGPAAAGSNRARRRSAGPTGESVARHAHDCSQSRRAGHVGSEPMGSAAAVPSWARRGSAGPTSESVAGSTHATQNPGARGSATADIQGTQGTGRSTRYSRRHSTKVHKGATRGTRVGSPSEEATDRGERAPPDERGDAPVSAVTGGAAHGVGDVRPAHCG